MLQQAKHGEEVAMRRRIGNALAAMSVCAVLLLAAPWRSNQPSRLQLPPTQRRQGLTSRRCRSPHRVPARLTRMRASPSGRPSCDAFGAGKGRYSDYLRGDGVAHAALVVEKTTSQESLPTGSMFAMSARLLRSPIARQCAALNRRRRTRISTTRKDRSSDCWRRMSSTGF
jgi:hypothetical protein